MECLGLGCCAKNKRVTAVQRSCVCFLQGPHASDPQNPKFSPKLKPIYIYIAYKPDVLEEFAAASGSAGSLRSLLEGLWPMRTTESMTVISFMRTI